MRVRPSFEIFRVLLVFVELPCIIALRHQPYLNGVCHSRNPGTVESSGVPLPGPPVFWKRKKRIGSPAPGLWIPAGGLGKTGTRGIGRVLQGNFSRGECPLVHGDIGKIAIEIFCRPG